MEAGRDKSIRGIIVNNWESTLRWCNIWQFQERGQEEGNSVPKFYVCRFPNLIFADNAMAMNRAVLGVAVLARYRDG